MIKKSFDRGVIEAYRNYIDKNPNTKIALYKQAATSPTPLSDTELAILGLGGLGIGGIAGWKLKEYYENKKRKEEEESAAMAEMPVEMPNFSMRSRPMIGQGQMNPAFYGQNYA